MAVYVDNYGARFGRMTMCHMLADTHEELLAMADAIGVKRKWIQKEGEPFEHFDICKTKRKHAVALGALEVTISEMGNILRNKRNESKHL